MGVVSCFGNDVETFYDRYATQHRQDFVQLFFWSGL
jgi:hypothetical protein